MSSPLVVGFNDFKTLCKNKRIYYYIGDDFFEFVFLSEGIMIKSVVLKSDIEDTKRFFSDSMFYNTMEIKFRIPNPKTNLDDIISLTPGIDIIQIQDNELKKIDIQREGVGEE